MKLGDLVCHRRYGTRREKGIGIVIDEKPVFGMRDILSVYWFKEGRDQQVWKQVLRYVK
tara:strand:+ start:340 stop:516 length:177 start_codon:yes stop_codon:yes gene_type:complete